MARRALIDLVTFDERNHEYALYIVEDGSWPGEGMEGAWDVILERVQARIFDLIDAAIDGQLAERYPDSEGKMIRIQVDSPSGVPRQIQDLIDNLRRYLSEGDNEYIRRIATSKHATAIRLVTGHEMGRFGNS